MMRRARQGLGNVTGVEPPLVEFAQRGDTRGLEPGALSLLDEDSAQQGGSNAQIMLRHTIRLDLVAYANHLELHRFGRLRRAYYLLFASTFVVVLLFRLSSSRIPVLRHLAKLCYTVCRVVTGIQLAPGTRVGGACCCHTMVPS